MLLHAVLTRADKGHDSQMSNAMTCPRALVGIDQATLAKHAKVSRKAVVTLESDSARTMDYRRVEVMNKLAEALEKKYGIEFTKPSAGKGEGVRLSKPKWG